MDAVFDVLQNYSKIITGGAVILAALILFILLTRILKHIKKLNKSVSSITENVQAYFDVILSEEGEDASQGIQQTAQQNEDGQERRTKMAEQQKKEEEEKIVNAVLQEYFT